MKRQSLFKIHRWIGLVAALWLFLLGITGIFLDHDEWRWLRQTEVPESWLSSSMMRYLPATVMRFVAVDKNDSDSWLGGSERGLWSTKDRGKKLGEIRIPKWSASASDSFCKNKYRFSAGHHFSHR